jgi:pantoate--beta-alanine ligase
VKILEAVDALQDALRVARHRGQSIGFVPTMGALHAGHLSLVKIAKQKADFVLASVFVNPSQFGPGEDLDAYPRNLASDAEKLQSAGCDLLFAPSVAQMYPDSFETKVTLSRTTQGLCGAHRPGHFDGVTTVVLKLFGMTNPDVAVFGRKDYQQLAVIRRMVEDLCLDIEIVGAPLVRESDGLAMSSRNAYLSEEERQRALSLSKGLFAAQKRYDGGERDAAILLLAVHDELRACGLDPEYLEIRTADTLEVLERVDRPGVVLVAARVGKTRLIDNLVLDNDSSGQNR